MIGIEIIYEILKKCIHVYINDILAHFIKSDRYLEYTNNIPPNIKFTLQKKEGSTF